MAAGRKTLPTAESNSPELVADAGSKMLEVANTVADFEKDEVLELGVDLGRLEALDFVATIASTAGIAIYQKVKKSKAWKHLRNLESGDGRRFQSLDEFCRVKLGRSDKRWRELAGNQRLLGEQAFEQAEKLGLRQVDYNAIKALPAPEQELVRRAVEESTNREEVLDVLQELAARHAKAKEAADKELEDLKAEQQADKQLLDKKNERIGELEQESERLKAKNKLADPNEEYEELLLVAAEGTSGELNRVATVWRQVFNALQDHDRKHDTDSRAIIGGYVQRMQQLCLELREQYHLQALDSEGKPAWMTADLDELPDARPEWMKQQQAEHAAQQAAAQNNGQA